MMLSLQDTAISTAPSETRANTNTLIEVRSAKTSSKTTKSKKETAYQQAKHQVQEVESDLHKARVDAVQARTKMGAYQGALNAPSCTLPNPGGGQTLLEDASCHLLWGRNWMGKSTLLRALAARRVGDIPINVTVHYVSQKVNLTKAQRSKTPVQFVVDADLERISCWKNCRR